MIYQPANIFEVAQLLLAEEPINRESSLARGLVYAQLPMLRAWQDLIARRTISDVGGDTLPVLKPDGSLGLAWDFSGSRRATLGNWGNEIWCGPDAQFSITVMLKQFMPPGGLIFAKGDSSGFALDLWDISVVGQLGRLQWTVRSDSGYLVMFTSHPVQHIIRPNGTNCVTVTCNLALSGSDRIQAWINTVNTSSGYEESGDMSAGIKENNTPIQLGWSEADNGWYWPGLMGGLLVHNRALAHDEINRLHQSLDNFSILNTYTPQRAFAFDWEVTPSGLYVPMHLLMGRAA